MRPHSDKGRRPHKSGCQDPTSSYTQLLPELGDSGCRPVSSYPTYRPAAALGTAAAEVGSPARWSLSKYSDGCSASWWKNCHRMACEDESDARPECHQADRDTSKTVLDPRKPAGVRVVGEVSSDLLAKSPSERSNSRIRASGSSFGSISHAGSEPTKLRTNRHPRRRCPARCRSAPLPAPDPDAPRPVPLLSSPPKAGADHNGPVHMQRGAGVHDVADAASGA